MTFLSGDSRFIELWQIPFQKGTKNPFWIREFSPSKRGSFQKKINDCTIVKISKKYIVGQFFEPTYSKGKHPLYKREKSPGDRKIPWRGNSAQPHSIGDFSTEIFNSAGPVLIVQKTCSV